MSALLQLPSYLEQPKVPPPLGPPPAGTRLREQPTEQPKPPGHAAPFIYIRRVMPKRQVPLDSLLMGSEDAYVIEYRATVAALNEQIRLREHLKPPEHVGEFQYIQSERPNREVRQDLVLKELEEVYVFQGRSAVAAFIERNRLRGLLLEARDPLNAAFGEAALKKLALVGDDEGFNTLFCLITVSGDMGEARVALRSFDRRWWLAHSEQAAGKLNFDFDLV